MFEASFWELAMVMVVALLVLGPERLPAVARTIGRWVGKIRIYLQNVKNDIDREIRLQELQEMMKQTERNAAYEFLESSADESKAASSDKTSPIGPDAKSEDAPSEKKPSTSA